MTMRYLLPLLLVFKDALFLAVLIWVSRQWRRASEAALELGKTLESIARLTGSKRA